MSKLYHGILFLCGGLSFVFTELISSLISVDGRIPSDVANLILPTLVDVNAVLIGFWSLILLYGLNFLRAERKELLMVIYRYGIEMSNLKIRKVTEKEAREPIEETERLYANQIVNVKKVIDKADEAIRLFSVFGFVVILLFIASIMLTVLGIGKVEANGLENVYFRSSLFFFFFSIILTGLGMYVTMPEKESFYNNGRRPNRMDRRPNQKEKV